MLSLWWLTTPLAANVCMYNVEAVFIIFSFHRKAWQEKTKTKRNTLLIYSTPVGLKGGSERYLTLTHKLSLDSQQ